MALKRRAVGKPPPCDTANLPASHATQHQYYGTDKNGKGRGFSYGARYKIKEIIERTCRLAYGVVTIGTHHSTNATCP